MDGADDGAAAVSHAGQAGDQGEGLEAGGKGRKEGGTQAGRQGGRKGQRVRSRKAGRKGGKSRQTGGWDESKLELTLEWQTIHARVKHSTSNWLMEQRAARAMHLSDLTCPVLRRARLPRREA